MKKLMMLMLPLLVACTTTTRTLPDNDAALAREVFGVTFPADTRPLVEGNFAGMRTNDLLFSRRTDSRTFFVHDQRGAARTSFQGSDARLLQIATNVLRHAGIPAAEIDTRRVIQEQLQHVNVHRATKTVLSRADVTKGMRIAQFTRHVGKVPVFNSRLVLTLDANERPTFAELHWPEIPAAVVTEAGRLQRMVAAGWKPPQQQRARVEKIEAGIVHSPAASMVMDFAPVIRVIYATENGGKKPMMFYDRSGRLVTPPRTFPALPAIKNVQRAQGKP